MGETVLYEKDGPVAIVRLNRPEKHNAMNREMTQALHEVFEELEADDSVRAIVLTGAGEKSFCAGGDMKERAEGLDADDQRARPEIAGRGDGGSAIERVSKPVIGAINGYAYGGGARLALSTDIRLASSNATFRFVGASYGLVVSASQLPRLVGASMAKELIFTTRVIDAEEALRLGIVNHVYPHEELLPAAIDMAKAIAANSADAVRWAKRVIDGVSVNPEGLEIEREANLELRASREHSERFRDAAARVVGSGN